MRLPPHKTAQNPVDRVKGRIARFTAELASLEKDGNANCARAHELRVWIWEDQIELGNILKQMR
jgi:hypothetical protein